MPSPRGKEPSPRGKKPIGFGRDEALSHGEASKDPLVLAESAEASSSSALLDGSTPNYAKWVAAGDEHCVIPYDRFWWRRAAAGPRRGDEYSEPAPP